jgi:hypothetical protein
LTALSFASEPELPKNTLDIGTGAISMTRSASRIALSDDIPEKVWQYDSLLACSSRASAISFRP